MSSYQTQDQSEKQVEAKSKKTIDDMVDWFDQWMDAENTSESVRIAELCSDFYHNRQWSTEAKKKLKSRGQPVVTFNKIQPKINAVIGAEISSRVDPKANPRTPSAQQDASTATDAIRYVADKEETNQDELKTNIATDAAIAGWGGSIWQPETIGEGESQEVELTCPQVPWDRLFWDPHSRKTDFSDAKFIGQFLFMDYSDAVMEYPDAEDVLVNCPQEQNSRSQRRSSETVEYFDSKRKRVRIVEIYWKEGGVWFTAKFTLSGFIEEPSKCIFVTPKNRQYCPLQMFSTYCDRHGFRYGIVWGLLDAQKEVNQRRSKALHSINTKLVFAEKGAVKNPMTAKQQLHKNDGWVELNPGALQQGKFQVQENQEITAGNLQLYQEAKEALELDAPGAQQTGQPAGSSGRAMMLSGAMANLSLLPFMNSLNKWEKRWHRAAWANIVQFWNYEKWFRVRDSRNAEGYKFVGINRLVTKGQRFKELVGAGQPPSQALISVLGQEMALSAVSEIGATAPEGIDFEQAVAQIAPGLSVMSQRMKANDVSQLDVDIVLDVSPNSAIIEHEQFQELMGLNREIVSMGQPGLPMDALIEASSLRDKQKILEMIRKPPSQEEQQQQQMMAQFNMQQMNLQLQNLQAQVSLLQATAAKEQVKAEKEAAKTQAEINKLESETAENNAEAMYDAARAGEKSAGVY